jgi:hypothetical protein
MPDLRGIPTSEPSRLRRVARRTLLVRLTLLAGLLAVFGLATLVARAQDVRHAPLVPSGKTGMLVLDLSASVYEGGFGQTIQKLAAADEKVGVVAFSDSAYELVPPGTPARELLPLLRYFGSTTSGGLPPHNPWEEFRAGTRISQGLWTARDIIQREHTPNASIVLVSDFEILPDEITRLAEIVGQLRSEGVEIRLVPLFPTPEKQERIKAILGDSAVLRGISGDAPIRAPESRSLLHAIPWTFVAVAALLVALLAANEGLLSRLEVQR